MRSALCRARPPAWQVEMTGAEIRGSGFRGGLGFRATLGDAVMYLKRVGRCGAPIFAVFLCVFRDFT